MLFCILIFLYLDLFLSSDPSSAYFFYPSNCLSFFSSHLLFFVNQFLSLYLCQKHVQSFFIIFCPSHYLSISVRPSVKTIFVLSLFVIPFFPVTQVCRTACRGRTLKTPTTLGQANGNLTMRMPQRWTEFDETCKTFAFACNPFLLILHWTCKNWNLFYFNLYWNLLFSKTATINEIIEN